MKERIKAVLEDIDDINRQDPNLETDLGKTHPKELLYSQRMSSLLQEYLGKQHQDIEESLIIAAHGQHIKRWAIPRSDYPADRKGYLKWRTQLKIMHGQMLDEIMLKHGYEESIRKSVVDLVNKKKLKTDSLTQILEDIVCLVFLKYYFHEFASKHAEDKVIDILRKTWNKMTENGQKFALNLPLPEHDVTLIKKALNA